MCDGPLLGIHDVPSTPPFNPTRPNSAFRAPRARSVASVSCGLVLMLAPAASAGRAQDGSGASEHSHIPARSRAALLERLSLPLDVEFRDHPLHDVVRYLELVSGASINPLWIDENHEFGLDPMAPTTLDARGMSALEGLERALDQAAAHQHLPMGATWQIAPDGELECGPRERLNRPAALRVEVYDVTDLLASIPVAPAAPRLRVQGVTRPPPRGNAIGAQWDFSDTGDSPAQPPTEAQNRTDQDPGTRLIQTITALVEPEQWIRNGGEAAAISLHEGALIVLAPDYVHRGLVGPLRASSVVEMRTKYE